MGLTQAVKDFFIAKINGKIAEDIQAIESTINRQQLKQDAFDKFIGEKGLDEVYTLMRIEDEIQELEERRERKQNELYAELEQAGIKLSSYGWRRDIVDGIRTRAEHEYLPALMKQTYPEEQAEIERLRAMRDDVEGVILLATTPTRLQASLASLLDQYGAHLEGIEKIVDLSK